MSLKFRNPIFCKGAELGHILLHAVLWYHIWGVHWCECIFLEWPWNTKDLSLKFQNPISCKGAELVYMLLYTVLRCHIWGDHWCECIFLEWPSRSMSRSLRLWKLICRKGPGLGYMLLLNISRRTCLGSSLVWLYLTIKWPWKISVNIIQISKAYISQ